MRKNAAKFLWTVIFFSWCGSSFGQATYRVIPVVDGGTISGSVHWVGPLPRLAEVPMSKEQEAVCDPEEKKKAGLDRLIVGTGGGVADTMVFLKDIKAGKSMLTQQQPHLTQKHCQYIPHIVLVPQGAVLRMESFDATLHTIHMEGAENFNLPFPPGGPAVSRKMSTPGQVEIRCNAGHVWMNAEMMVISHPYYAVTDESGRFQLADVPAGTYEIVAWHEGWEIAGQRDAYYVSTNNVQKLPVFTEAQSSSKTIIVRAAEETAVEFTFQDSKRK